MTIISLADAKQQLRIAQSDTSQDDEVQLFLMAVTSVIELHTGKAINQRTEVERHYGVTGVVWLRHRPVISLTSVVSVDGLTTWSTSNLDRDDAWGRLEAKPGTTALSGDLIVTDVVGLTSTPENYRLAARIILQHLYETTRGQMGAPRFGGQDIAPVPMGFAIPNRALELLGPRVPVVA